MFADRPDMYRREVLSEICELSPERLTNLLRSANNATDDSLLVSTGPSPGDRTKPKGAVASQYILEECCGRILKGEVEQMKTMFNILYKQPDQSAIPGMLFEHRAHQFLQEERILDLFPILASTTPENENYVYKDYTSAKHKTKRVSLPKLAERTVTKETTAANHSNTYYRPQSTNFPAIGSWVFHQPQYYSETFLAFQMTLDAEKLDVKQVNLDRMDKLVPGRHQKYLVIFTPKGVEPHITVPAKHIAGKIGYGRDVNEAFPVFHCPIDIAALFSKSRSHW